MQLLTRPDSSGDGEQVAEGAEREEPLSGAARFRALIAAAAGPLLTGYAAVATSLALVTAIAPQSRFSATGVLAAAGPGWLAAHLVPLEIAGRPLGVLPLLVTIGICVLIARTAGSAADRLGYRDPGQAIVLIGTMAGAHAVFGATIAVLTNARPASAEPLPAFLVPGLLAGVAALAGVARRCGIWAAVSDYLDPVAMHGLRAGALGLAGLVAVGALMLALSLALSTSTSRELFAANAPGFGSGLGMLLLCLGYLPNAVVFGVAFATGPGFSIGSVSLTPYQFTGGGVPAMPLLAAIPEHQAAWWPILMLLPALVGALVGWSLRRVHTDRMARLRTVGVAGALVGFGCVLLGTLAGGRLGSGPFTPVAVPVGLVSVAAFVWITIPGALVAWFAGPREVAEPEETAEIVTEVDLTEESDEDELTEEDSEETETDFAELAETEDWDELLELELSELEDLDTGEEPESEGETASEEPETASSEPESEDGEPPASPGEGTPD
jgi:hypothetical protein